MIGSKKAFNHRILPNGHCGSGRMGGQNRYQRHPEISRNLAFSRRLIVRFMDKCKELTCPKLPGLRHVLEEIIMDEKRLLIVDDEKHIRMLYSSEFEALGYAVATSDGLEDIKRVLNREKPHVIVLDINLGASPYRAGFAGSYSQNGLPYSSGFVYRLRKLPARRQILCSRLLRSQKR